MEALWEIVMQVRSEEVYKLASEFLAKIYKKLDKETIDQRLP